MISVTRMKVKMLIIMSDPRKASAEILRRDQRSDRSLIHYWSLADRHKIDIRLDTTFETESCIVIISI